MTHQADISHKTKVILTLLFAVFLLIFVRVGYLATIKRQHYVAYAQKPQQRTVVIPALRGPISDRFGLPLALNKIQYHAAIIYSEIRATFPRKKERCAYLKRLTSFLAQELTMPVHEVEDLIHGQAAIFPHTPCVMRGDLPEPLYYRLRTLEKNWCGLKIERKQQRFYPQGKVASHLIGYLGAIDSRQHRAIERELATLQSYLTQWEGGLPVPLPKGFTSAAQIQQRYDELRDKAYTMRSQVGKTGVERTGEEVLRGYFGKQRLEVDSQGRVIQTLPTSTPPTPGREIQLTLSLELQRYAEALLATTEQERERLFPFAGKNHFMFRPPWIKGGALIALDPTTGEILALASYPRFDPNDFALLGSGTPTYKNSKKIHEWLEDAHYRAGLWDGTSSFKRELFDTTTQTFTTETRALSWECYLDHILSQRSSVRAALNKVRTLADALHIVEAASEVATLFPDLSLSLLLDAFYSPRAPRMASQQVKEREQALYYLTTQATPLLAFKTLIDPFLSSIPHNSDKLLFLDLLRLIADPSLFTPELKDAAATLSLAEYRTLTQAFCHVQYTVKTLAQALYHRILFPQWRSLHFFTSYLPKKRKKEAELSLYARPYTDYLKEVETLLFRSFWNRYRWPLITTYLFQELPSDPALRSICFQLLLKSQTSSHWSLPLLRTHYASTPSHIRLASLKTMRPFSALDAPLWGHYPRLSRRSLHPPTLAQLAAYAYPRHGFGYGKSYAYSHAAPPASLFKIVTGYETLCQRAQRSHGDLHPLTLYDSIDAQGTILGKTADGTPIPRRYKGGRLPRSDHPIGWVDFEGALATSSNLYFSLLAKEHLAESKDLRIAAKAFGFAAPTAIEVIGEVKGNIPDDLEGNTTALYATAIGQHTLTTTPMQWARALAALANPTGSAPAPHLIRSPKPQRRPCPLRLPFPEGVRRTLLQGLQRAISSPEGTAHFSHIRKLRTQPEWRHNYRALQGQWVGKTATAELAYRPTLDKEAPSILAKDLWFGAISFEENALLPLDKRQPELVVIVYLRFGSYGKEAAPLAAQLIKKWREIKQAHKTTTATR